MGQNASSISRFFWDDWRKLIGHFSLHESSTSFAQFCRSIKVMQNQSLPIHQRHGCFRSMHLSKGSEYDHEVTEKSESGGAVHKQLTSSRRLFRRKEEEGRDHAMPDLFLSNPMGTSTVRTPSQPAIAFLITSSLFVLPGTIVMRSLKAFSLPTDSSRQTPTTS